MSIVLLNIEVRHGSCILKLSFILHATLSWSLNASSNVGSLIMVTGKLALFWKCWKPVFILYKVYSLLTWSPLIKTESLSQVFQTSFELCMVFRCNRQLHQNEKHMLQFLSCVDYNCCNFFLCKTIPFASFLDCEIRNFGMHIEFGRRIL